MPVAAVPEYLGRDFKDASPGMRFGMYLPIWTDRTDQEADVKKRSEAKSREGGEVADMLNREGMDATIRALRQRQPRPLAGLWDKNDFAAKTAWALVVALSKRDKDLMKALAERQGALHAIAPVENSLTVDALSIAPFTTGLGNEHPLENGFAFLNPYGLPYLPGTGVKGVLRQAARELASGEWCDNSGWRKDKCYLLEAGKERIPLSMIDALFGLEAEDGEKQHVRGALTFWDVIPQIKGDSLTVDIMTPHQGHYYQQKQGVKTGKSITPHDSGQPVPISFLTVPLGSGFTFHVQCDVEHLARTAPELAEEGRWKVLLKSAFDHAFDWLGFGAKTAVGYGQMEDKAQIALEKEAAYVRSLEASGIKMGVAVWDKAKVISTDPGAGNITIQGPGGRQATGKFYSQLSDAAKKRFKNKKEVTVNAEIEERGNLIEIKSLTEPGQ
jgi:CRISPR-associated protein Cmr6